MKFMNHRYDVRRWGKPSSTGFLTIHASLVGVAGKIHHFVFVFSESEFGGTYTILRGVLIQRGAKICPSVVHILQAETFDPRTYLDHTSINYYDSRGLAKHFAPVLYKQLGAKQINVNMYGKKKMEKRWMPKGNGFMSQFILEDAVWDGL